MRKVFGQLIITYVVVALIAELAAGSLAPRSVQAAETQLTTSLLRVVPVSQGSSVVGFDLWADGKVVAPIRLSSNGLITAGSAVVTSRGTSQTLTITGLQGKAGAGVTFAPSDYVAVTVTEGQKY